MRWEYGGGCRSALEEGGGDRGRGKEGDYFLFLFFLMQIFLQ